MPCVLNTCGQDSRNCTSLICKQGLHRVDTDDPLCTPEESESWLLAALYVGLALVVLLITALAIAPHL